MHAPLEAPARSAHAREGHAPDPAAVALAFASVPLSGTAEQCARACVAAIRALTPGPVRLEVPTYPVPLTVGDAAPAMVQVVAFPAPGARGRCTAARTWRRGPRPRRRRWRGR